ncbi:hypothetical protein [Natrinema longum]|uniref:DUF1102 domain-containing protein n=1 Tax=Natrinema longum TaxID=370324 RepID=A0A8A2U6D4_9EURY|nr:hypothetical protein [Natrinema longum]MBZ6494406.1 hypothetical protein [Natrinema longum]QSW84271.1 hypothetical protein J0X27_12520 [Natrinema longum]
MNRRNVLVGLGAIVASGGAALGTGAFSTVEANRTVEVTTAGDANAFIGLEPGTSINTGAVSAENGTLEIDLGSDFGQTSGSGGVNYNATTSIGAGDSGGVSTAAFTITNNGDSPADISVSVTGDNPSYLHLYAENTNSSTTVDLTSGTSISLAAGNSLDVAVVVDLTGVDQGDWTSGENIASEITITADTTA